jgi:hypothetical protein
MPKLFPFWLLLFVFPRLHAQQNFIDSSNNSHPEISQFVKNYYYRQKGNEAAIYNGTLYYANSSEIEGNAYFNSGDWLRGDVDYDGIIYKNIFLKYDIVKDELIVTPNETNGVPICLFGPRVKRFSFSGYTFIRVDNSSTGTNSTAGFYQQLIQGKVSALAKTTKTISEKIVDNKVARKFEQKIKYYALKEGQLFHIENKKDLLRVLEDHKKETQAFIKEKKLNFRDDPEKTIASVVEYYNHL